MKRQHPAVCCAKPFGIGASCMEEHIGTAMRSIGQENLDNRPPEPVLLGAVEEKALQLAVYRFCACTNSRIRNSDADYESREMKL